MTSRHFIRSFVLLALSWMFGTLNAAEISVVSNGSAISISGPIQRGDYKQLAHLIWPTKNFAAFVNWVYLDSPGGDVVEAMKIAKLMELSLSRTMVQRGATCASSCFLLWSAGSTRLLDGNARLGVHRISWTSESIDIGKTERTVKPVSQSLEAFLQDAGIPSKVINKMNETSPKDIFLIDNKWLANEEIIGSASDRPGFLDVAEKKCGVSPTNGSQALRKTPSANDINQWDDCANAVRMENIVMRMTQIKDVIATAHFGK